MSKTLTEQKVLKKLNIEDFRHLTKDKVISMATLLDKMDPEVAKKAIEQFPDFSNAMKDIFAEYRKTLDKALDSDEKSVASFYDTCDAIITTCQKELDKEELSFEERKYILEQMLIVANMKFEKDSEGKKFRLILCSLGVAAFTITAGALSSVLGGKFDIDSIKKLS